MTHHWEDESDLVATWKMAGGSKSGSMREVQEKVEEEVGALGELGELAVMEELVVAAAVVVVVE